MKGYLVKSPLRHDGERYKKGDFIDAEILDEQSAKRLLFLDVVSKAVKEDESEIIPDQTGQDKKLDGATPPGEETINEILDTNFELDELKEGAKEVGLTFAANLGKAKLIALIVENEKQDYFLDQLED
ncbi:MAG: hypothetical protein ABS917_05425 [Solibacillus sp.]|uniref:hypothetical protein n=1 Tax=Solibacillus sp. TaxID=1909654 RepID=UPI0033151579